MKRTLRYPKAGDRVAVYCCSRMLDGAKGTVIEYDGAILAYVELDQYALKKLDAIQPFHIGQLRRLKKRTRKRAWVGEIAFSGAGFNTCRFLEARTTKPSPHEETSNGEPWREFVEVRRK